MFFRDIPKAIHSVALTPNGKWALTGSYDCTARIWNLSNSDSSPRVLSGHTDSIHSVALTPDGKWALTGSDDKTARLWELVPRLSFAEVQKIIGAHEEATRSNDGP